MKTVKQRSQRQEKSVAKDFNAKTTVASGSKWGMKADVRNDKFLIECKTTQKDYYPLTAKVWEKIEEEAIRDRGRIPLMIIDLQDKFRMVVFNPKYFERNPPAPYDCTGDGEDHKSYRVSLSDLWEAENIMCEYIYGKLFIICGIKRNMLFCMRYSDFEEAYKEELK